jgi:RNA-directed DNA polymerase
VQAGLLSREIRHSGVPTLSKKVEGNTAGGVSREPPAGSAWSKNQGMYGTFMRENRESPCSPVRLISGRAVQGTLRR